MSALESFEFLIDLRSLTASGVKKKRTFVLKKVLEAETAGWRMFNHKPATRLFLLLSLKSHKVGGGKGHQWGVLNILL